MKYEIRKRSKVDPSIWYAVAWTDTKEWADKISHALNMCDDGEFAVFVEERPGAYG